MVNNLDIHKIFQIINIIREKGTFKDGDHLLHGLRLSSDLEGYNITLSYKNASLNLFFHNSYEFDYKKKIELVEFENILEEIGQKYIQSQTGERFQLFKDK